MSKKKAVIVLGVGSDGTSLFAGLLHKLGFYLGPDEDLIAPNKQNPKGFYEHKRIPDINRVIMTKEHGVGEYEPGHIIESSIYQNEVEAFFESTFANHNRVALKDPRFCVTLPVWASVIERTHALTILSVDREPNTHLAALLNGGKKNMKTGMDYIVNRKELQAELTKRYASVTVGFEELLDFPEDRIRWLVKELKTRATKKQIAEIMEFIS